MGRIKEGTRCLLFQSGLCHAWWADATHAYCQVRNLHDVVRDGKTPYELRHNEPVAVMKIPFGALVTYKPSATRELKQMSVLDPRFAMGFLWDTISIAAENGQAITR